MKLAASRKRFVAGVALRGSAGLLAFSATVMSDAYGSERVITVTPQSDAVNRTVTLTATVNARRDAALSTRVSGLIERIAVDAGDVVASGDILLALDDTLARLEQQRAEVLAHEGRTRMEEALRLRDEQEQLAADGRIPASSFKSQEAAVRLARSALARLNVERDLAEEQQRRHVLVAPFGGVIRRRLADPGEWVETGTPVLELVAIDALYVDIQAPQALIDDIAPGDPATVVLDARPGDTLPGKVAARVPVTDAEARTFLVRVAIDASSSPLVLPGLSARVTLDLGAEQDVLVIPRDAVNRFPDGTTTVWTVIRDTGAQDGHLAQEQRVTLGKARGDHVVVLDGLSADARVVVRGNERLREGQAVSIVDRDAATE